MKSKPIYLDFNATTPIHPEVWDIVTHYSVQEFGNPGSRTHIYGQSAKKAIEDARRVIASHFKAEADEVVFTSGATEANNLAILGLKDYAIAENRKHIITTRIEHKAVLEPIEYLESQGFEVTYLEVDSNCRIDPEHLRNILREDTLLVSIMHANNETGVIQPIDECAAILAHSEAFFHCDAAQTFGKIFDVLSNPRIDMISVSGHKIYGPKGIGALLIRRREFGEFLYEFPPIKSLMFGGGQENGLRPGTLPTPLIAGLGKALQISIRDRENRLTEMTTFRSKFLEELKEYNYEINGNSDHCLPHVLNVTINDWDSEAFMLQNKERWAMSNGSACTSNSYTTSHVLRAMYGDCERLEQVIRFSWGVDF